MHASAFSACGLCSVLIKYSIMKKMILCAAAVVAAVCAAGCGKTQEAAQATAETVQESAEAAAEAAENTVAQLDAALAVANGKVSELDNDEVLRPDVKVAELTVVDFNATWCGPCKKFAPTFEEIAGEYAGKALFYSVDVDVHPELAAEYGVQGIPHIQFINPADPAANTSLVGLQTKEDFTAALNAFLK